MVSRILISIALLCSSVAMSQSIDLSLSRVITIDTLYNSTINVGEGGWIRYSENYQVPEGKVWKVEYVYPYEKWTINDEVEINFIVYSGDNQYASNSLIMKEFWLNSGDKIKFKKTGQISGNSSYQTEISYFLSILEFNTD
jgi:hypothetical protein